MVSRAVSALLALVLFFCYLHSCLNLPRASAFPILSNDASAQLKDAIKTLSLLNPSRQYYSENNGDYLQRQGINNDLTPLGVRSHSRREFLNETSPLGKDPVTDEEWCRWLKTGLLMESLMLAWNDEAAQSIFGSDPSENPDDIEAVDEYAKWRGRTTTSWHDPNALERFGWLSSLDDDAKLEELVNTYPAIVEAGLSLDESDWASISTLHSENWRSDAGEEIAGSLGTYEFMINMDQEGNDIVGAIVLTLTFSPEYMIKSTSVEHNSRPPPLARMSDVVFLSYYSWLSTAPQYSQALLDQGGSKIPCPRYIFIDDIAEEELVEVIFPEIARRDSWLPMPDGSIRLPPTWQQSDGGFTYRPSGDPEDDDFYYVIMATKQARGVALFLITHKEEFGPKTILSITVWGGGSGPDNGEGYRKPCLRFEIGDSPPNSGIDNEGDDKDGDEGSEASFGRMNSGLRYETWT